MLRYSLLGLLIAVAIAAVFFAALARPSALWMQTTATLTLMMLLAAAIMALFARGQLRAFSCGAVVVGMTLRFFVLPQESFAMEPSKLLSSTVLTWSFEKLHGGEGVVDSGIIFHASDDGDLMAAPASPNEVSTVNTNRHRFMAIGNELLTVLTSFLGGVFALYCATRGRNPVAPLART
jgi:hypothetical protein